MLMESANTPPQPPSPLVTDVRRDLALFDAVFALLAPRAAGGHQPGRGCGLAVAGSPEEIEDAEIVHAIALDALHQRDPDPELDRSRKGGSPPWKACCGWPCRSGPVVSLSAILGEECFTPSRGRRLEFGVLQADEEHHETE